MTALATVDTNPHLPIDGVTAFTDAELAEEIRGLRTLRWLVALNRHEQEFLDVLTVEKNRRLDLIPDGSETRPCYRCDPATKPIRVVQRLKTVNPADPTQGYLLACDHTVIDL